MKRKSLTYLLTVLMSMVGVNAFAAFDTSTKVQVGNLYYYLDTSNHLAEVTSMPSGKYSGDIVIPASFTYNNGSYSVTSIGEFAFSGCGLLTSVEIPNSVTSIGRNAFDYCYNLTSVTIPNSVTSIGNFAFVSCTRLEKVIVEDIAAWCNISFANDLANPLTNAHHLYSDANTEITDLVIPNSVTSIGNYVFCGCSGLTSVKIPNSVTSIGNSAFYQCSGLTSVEIPNNVTSIGDIAFCECSGLYSVEIPNNVTSIGKKAFRSCSGLTSVEIPASVTSIGEEAFRDCSSLTEVTVEIETPLTISEKVFSNRANATLYVPKGCTGAYLNAQYWHDFNSIEEIPDKVSITMATGSGSPRSMIGYSSKHALDFRNVTDVKAYIVVGYNDRKEAMLVHVDIVPPYTGLVIKTNNPGVVVDVPFATDDYYYVNLLVPVVSLHTIYPTETIDGEEYTNFVIGTLNSGEIGFVRLTSSIQRRNMSYLRVPSRLYNTMSNAPALGGIGMEIIDDETTGINPIDNSQLMKDNVYYDLNGRHVENPTKGLYIVNGKKIVIK